MYYFEIRRMITNYYDYIYIYINYLEIQIFINNYIEYIIYIYILYIWCEALSYSVTHRKNMFPLKT